MSKTEREARRYRAFISYSQKDKRHAKRLHKALESYRAPRGLDAPLDLGPNRRLGRFFRDDDELGAVDRLGVALEGALDDSEHLIVVCSPNAAASRWVNEEVKHFKSRRNGARVFAVIVDGAPHAQNPAQECFPPALRYEVDREGS